MEFEVKKNMAENKEFPVWVIGLILIVLIFIFITTIIKLVSAQSLMINTSLSECKFDLLKSEQKNNDMINIFNQQIEEKNVELNQTIFELQECKKNRSRIGIISALLLFLIGIYLMW